MESQLKKAGWNFTLVAFQFVTISVIIWLCSPTSLKGTYTGVGHEALWPTIQCAGPVSIMQQSMSKSPCWMSGRTVDSCYYTVYKKKRVKQIWSNLAIVCSCLGGGQMDAPYFSVFFLISLQRETNSKIIEKTLKKIYFIPYHKRLLSLRNQQILSLFSYSLFSKSLYICIENMAN